MKVLLGVIAGVVVTVLVVSLSTYVGTVLFDVGDGSATSSPGASYLGFNIVMSMLAAMAGGYATTGFGNATSRTPAVVLAALFMVLGLSAVLSGPAPGQPAWYPILMLFIAPPLIFAGAELAFRRRRAADGSLIATDV